MQAHFGHYITARAFSNCSFWGDIGFRDRRLALHEDCGLVGGKSEDVGLFSVLGMGEGVSGAGRGMGSGRRCAGIQLLSGFR